MTSNYKEISTLIDKKILGCHFVGISENDEVFVEYDHEDEELEFAAILKLKNEFPYISKVIRVVRPSVTEAKDMMEGLNKYLNEMEALPKKNNLLSIE